MKEEKAMPYTAKTMEYLKRTSPAQSEFYQATQEVLVSLRPLLDKEKKYEKHNIIERLVEPERQIMFKITWVDDNGIVQVNKGYRVEFNSALGPYKGGLRFHHSVNAGIIKFLGFEQIFKNALTGLQLGGGKGGSNFNPKDKSDGEIMRFCQAFMNELYRHIGPTTDVPAGDIGVGAREIGYMFGQYKKLTGRYEGILTGKGLNWGGSLARKEATGYGAVYFAQNMLEAAGHTLEGKTCVVSGAGNVAIYTIEKLYELGAVPVSASDSRGVIYDRTGINLETLKELKENKKVSLAHYLDEHPSAIYTPTELYDTKMNSVWTISCDVAFPCATQNELNLNAAKELIKNGCICVSEGANMPSTADAVNCFQESKNFLYGPGKAANAGGVATSQLEMSQNASMQSWDFQTVDNKLKKIMQGIYVSCSETAKEYNSTNNFVLGANIAGFKKVADAMIDQGIV